MARSALSAAGAPLPPHISYSLAVVLQQQQHLQHQQQVIDEVLHHAMMSPGHQQQHQEPHGPNTQVQEQTQGSGMTGPAGVASSAAAAVAAALGILSHRPMVMDETHREQPAGESSQSTAVFSRDNKEGGAQGAGVMSGCSGAAAAAAVDNGSWSNYDGCTAAGAADEHTTAAVAMAKAGSSIEWHATPSAGQALSQGHDVIAAQQQLGQVLPKPNDYSQQSTAEPEQASEDNEQDHEGGEGEQEHIKNTNKEVEEQQEAAAAHAASAVEPEAVARGGMVKQWPEEAMVSPPHTTAETAATATSGAVGTGGDNRQQPSSRPISAVVDAMLEEVLSCLEQPLCTAPAGAPVGTRQQEVLAGDPAQRCLTDCCLLRLVSSPALDRKAAALTALEDDDSASQAIEKVLDELLADVQDSCILSRISFSE